MTRLAKVRCINHHWDKVVRAQRRVGEEFVIARDSAQRRTRANLVEVIEEWDDAAPAVEVKVKPMAEAIVEETSDLDESVDEDKEPEEEVIQEPGEELLKRRGKSAWYDVDGHDDNPVSGKKNALAIAISLLDA